MKNYEKYAEEIRNFEHGQGFCDSFVIPHVLKPNNRECTITSCNHCHLLTSLWLQEEYKEPKTDWSKVAVDAPILVKRENDEKWYRKHFAKYEDGKVYTWGYGRTSWTGMAMDFWECAKLAEVEENANNQTI